MNVIAALLGWALLPTIAAAEPPSFPGPGDQRIVLVGNTLIEREQRYGYWEALLTSRFPDQTITFRNLGWSGDTVWGEARAGFDTAKEGFRRLTEHVAAVKPTVIVVGYGGNEAFGGEAGLPRFREGLDRLLDELARTGARIILLAPPRQEDLGPPLPDPRNHNHDLGSYTSVLSEAAQRRGLRIVDLLDVIGEPSGGRPRVRLTDDGLHLTAAGYARTAGPLARGLGVPENRWSVEVGAGGKVERAEGATVRDSSRSPWRAEITDVCLPAAGVPSDRARILRVHGLAAGRYRLLIDGRPVATADRAEWASGVPLTRGPEFDQAESLRRAIVEKNRQYFHRWRPQNETYLFGFRKYEQGQNAREVPGFDSLVAELEREIARLRVPVPHRYELVPTDAPKK